MNMNLLIAALALVGLAGCASQAPAPAGMATGKFVQYACADGKTFSARAAEDGTTVRVRALHGSAELDRKAGGIYEGEGYTLVTQGADAVSLLHDGKAHGKQCKPAA